MSQAFKECILNLWNSGKTSRDISETLYQDFSQDFTPEYIRVVVRKARLKGDPRATKRTSNFDGKNNKDGSS